MKRADIIVLAGQSNAVGYSKVNCLPKHFSAERIQKWRDGYENVKINYFSHYKRSNGFVPTTLGCTMLEDETLGPEVGMAEALDEKYPGREFFIVKFAFGGMNLDHDFLSPSGEENGRLVMPVSVRLNHAIADGYLIAEVYRLLQQAMEAFVGK